MSLKVSLVDCIYQGYKTDTGRMIPSVVLVGRREDRERVAYRKVFYPYVLIDDKAWSEESFGIDQFGIKEVNYNALPGMSGQAIRRFTVYTPRNAEALERYFQKIFRTRVYESDLMKPENMGLKYLIDSGIKSGFTVEEDCELKPSDVYVPLRTWLADSEVLGTSTGKINPYRDEPICLFTFYDNYLDVYQTLYWHDQMFKPIFPNHVGLKCKDEEHLIRSILERLDTLGPDVVGLHNGERYDIPKLIERMKKYQIDVNLLSPKPFRHVDTKRFPARVSGRFFMDTLKALIFFTNKELGRYSLEYVIETEKLPIVKVPMPRPTQDLWNDTPFVEQSFVELYDSLDDEVKKYFVDAGITREEFRPSYIMWLRNVLDVKALRLLEEKQKIMKAFDTLRRSNGGLMEDIYLRNRIIDTRLLRMCSRICVLPSTNRLGGKKEQTGGFQGGYVHEPTIGLHEKIGLLDFKRQYPNIMISFNISPETYVDLNAYSREEAEAEAKKRNLYFIVSHDGSTFYAFKKSPLGLIPRMLLDLMDERAYYEKEEVKCIQKAKQLKESNPAEAKEWDAKASDFKYQAWYTKVTLDGTFGVLGWTGFRLYKLACSAAIPCVGQYGTKEAIRYIGERYHISTYYADTDSSFFQILESMGLEEVKQIVADVNDHLAVWAAEKWGVTRPPFSFALKRIYDSFLLMTKKQYTGMYSWDEKKGQLDKPDFDYKGSAAIRSDASTFEKEILKDIIERALKRESTTDIMKSYHEKIDRLNMHTIPLHDLAYPGKLKKPFEWNEDSGIWHYKGRPGKNKKTGKKILTVPSHIKAAIYSNFVLDEGWRQGDKPSRLPINKKHIRNYPTKYSIMMKNGQTKEYILNAIAIDESSKIPQEFIDAIDWDKITQRIEKKVADIFRALNIKTSVHNTMDRYLPCPKK